MYIHIQDVPKTTGLNQLHCPNPAFQHSAHAASTQLGFFKCLAAQKPQSESVKSSGINIQYGPPIRLDLRNMGKLSSSRVEVCMRLLYKICPVDKGLLGISHIFGTCIKRG